MASPEEHLVERLRLEAGAIASAVAAEVRAKRPTLFTEDRHDDLARATVLSLLREFETVLRFGIVENFHAPSSAVAFARDHARLGTHPQDVQRGYEIGRDEVFARLCGDVALPAPPPAPPAGPGPEVFAEPDDDEVLVDDDEFEGDEPGEPAAPDLGHLAVAFAQAVLRDVARASEDERLLDQRRALARREAIVRDLMLGREVDHREAEQALGYRLGGEHRAIVLVGEAGTRPDPTILLRRHGRSRPLVTESGLWLRADTDRPTDWEAVGEDLRTAGVRAGVGDPGDLLHTREQAEVAATIARLRPDATLVFYGDVALGALLLRDRPAAERFAKEQLGDLADDPALRATVQAWLNAGGDEAATATALNTHRNTIRRRLSRAERVLGRPLDERPRELDAALLILALLDPVLAPGG